MLLAVAEFAHCGAETLLGWCCMQLICSPCWVNAVMLACVCAACTYDVISVLCHHYVLLLLPTTTVTTTPLLQFSWSALTARSCFLLSCVLYHLCKGNWYPCSLSCLKNETFHIPDARLSSDFCLPMIAALTCFKAWHIQFFYLVWIVSNSNKLASSTNTMICLLVPLNLAC